MAEESFWERSWKAFKSEAIAFCADPAGFAEDPLIRYLMDRGAASVCDAGCGCGSFSLRLATSGLRVSGFDLSAEAVALTRRLLSDHGYPASGFRTADVRCTGYADETFDAAAARDVLDHMPIRDGTAALKELIRIVKPGGCVLLTLDGTDNEYESEPHEIDSDGDYLYTDGRWNGMVFHPYTPGEIERLTRGFDAGILSAAGNRYTVVLDKPRFRSSDRVF